MPPVCLLLSDDIVRLGQETIRGVPRRVGVNGDVWAGHGDVPELFDERQEVHELADAHRPLGRRADDVWGETLRTSFHVQFH